MMKTIGVLIMGLLGALYLVNPGAGVFEFIPDNLPFIGNLDEAGAAFLVIAALRYFGLDLTHAFMAHRLKGPKGPQGPSQP